MATHPSKIRVLRLLARGMQACAGGNLTDAQLVEAARADRDSASSRQAFERLVVRYERFVRTMLIRLSGRQALADDLAQETFLSAWLKLADLRDPARFGGWIKQLAYRQFLHKVRRERLEQRTLQAHFSQLLHNHARDSGHDSVGGAEPMTAMDHHEQLDLLLRACNPLERELVVLSYGFGFTVAELAEARDTPAGTIKSHLHRAKRKMREGAVAPAQNEGRQSRTTHAK